MGFVEVYTRLRMLTQGMFVLPYKKPPPTTNNYYEEIFFTRFDATFSLSLSLSLPAEVFLLHIINPNEKTLNFF